MALLLVLILMGVGMLLLTPLLSFMATGLHTTYEVFDPKARELYAADAGVREAMWRIRNQESLPLESEFDTRASTSGNSTPLIENEDNIAVRISTIQIPTGNTTGSDNLTAYRIVSVATDPTSGHQTSIDALVYSVNLTSFADKIITSPTEVSLQSGSTVTGNGHEMWLPAGYPSTGGTGNPATINDAPWNSTPIIGWPSASSLAEYYAGVKGTPPPSDPEIDANGVMTVSENVTIGPFYYEGDLTIKKAKGSGVPPGNIAVNLGGTVFIRGSLSIDKNIELNLYKAGTVSPNPRTTIDSVGGVPVGTTMLTVSGNMTGFGSSGLILVGIGTTSPEYLKYTGIEGHNIILEGATTKIHGSRDPVEAFLQVPNTIFIEGTPGTWSFSSTPDCTINGPGAIIATGDIEFLPKVDADSGFIYVMSLAAVKFQPATSSETPPSGFTGSVVGAEFLPMHRSDYTYPLEGYPLNLNIPMGENPAIIGGIALWKIY